MITYLFSMKSSLGQYKEAAMTNTGTTIYRGLGVLVLAALLLAIMGTGARGAIITPQWGIGSTDGAALETAFFSGYTDVTTETFAGFTANTQGPLTLTVGALTGGGYIGDDTTAQSGTGEYSVGSDVNYWSNGTPGQTGNKNGYTLSFADPVTAFGFYALDFHDVGGEVELTFSTLGGDTTLNLYDLVGEQSNGSLIYFAFSSSDPISSVGFARAGGDGYAIDNISTATPIPGAVWLLGGGLVGLLGLRRRGVV